MKFKVGDIVKICCPDALATRQHWDGLLLTVVNVNTSKGNAVFVEVANSEGQTVEYYDFRFRHLTKLERALK